MLTLTQAIECVRLISCSFGMDATGPLRPSQRGRTALHEAASLGRDVFASILLKHPRIQVDVMDKVLLCATFGKRARLPHLLLSRSSVTRPCKLLR